MKIIKIKIKLIDNYYLSSILFFFAIRVGFKKPCFVLCFKHL